MTFTPLNDNILVKPIVDEEKVNGIIVPPSKKQRAVVVAVSEELKISLRPNDRVVYERDRGIPIYEDGMVIIKPNDLIIL